MCSSPFYSRRVLLQGLVPLRPGVRHLGADELAEHAARAAPHARAGGDAGRADLLLRGLCDRELSRR